MPMSYYLQISHPLRPYRVVLSLRVIASRLNQSKSTVPACQQQQLIQRDPKTCAGSCSPGNHARISETILDGRYRAILPTAKAAFLILFLLQTAFLSPGHVSSRAQIRSL